MLVSTSIPLSVARVPARAVVQAIYATAPVPSGGFQRVQVVCVRPVFGNFSHPPYKVADVRGLFPNAIDYSVRIEELKYISAFVTEEVL